MIRLLPVRAGTSEQYAGRALRDFAKRDEAAVAAKFLPRIPEEIEKGRKGRGLGNGKKQIS